MTGPSTTVGEVVVETYPESSQPRPQAQSISN
jgi:hypothetical protein